MTRIFHTPEPEHYVIIPVPTVGDTRLSWAARGLLAYLLSRPRDWEVIPKHLVKQGNLRRDGVYKLLKELREYRYVRHVRIRGASGAYTGGSYFVNDWAFALGPRPDSADAGRADMAPPHPVTPDDLPTTDVYLSRTTTTTTTEADSGGNCAHAREVDALHLPESIAGAECDIALELVQGLEPAIQQAVLDEWVGIVEAGAIKRSAIGCLRALVERAAQGWFTEERGQRVRQQREARRRERTHDDGVSHRALGTSNERDAASAQGRVRRLGERGRGKRR